MEPIKDKLASWLRPKATKTTIDATSAKYGTSKSTQEPFENNFEKIKQGYDQIFALAIKPINLKGYLTNPEERIYLEALREHGLKKAALKLMDEKRVPADILSMPESDLEQIRNDHWFNVLKKFATEETALAAWILDVAEANAAMRPEPLKPEYVTTNLFMAAANELGIGFKEARFAIEQYDKLCKSTMFPTLGNMILLDTRDLKDSLGKEEMHGVLMRLAEWAYRWHEEEIWVRFDGGGRLHCGLRSELVQW